MILHKVNDKYVFVAGQLFLMGTSFLFNLVAAKLIGPQQMGEWQTISLISIYGMILTFGIINGMGRDVPYFRGKGDETRSAEPLQPRSCICLP